MRILHIPFKIGKKCLKHVVQFFSQMEPKVWVLRGVHGPYVGAHPPSPPSMYGAIQSRFIGSLRHTFLVTLK